MDERDIALVCEALGRVVDQCGQLLANAAGLPDTPGWHGPTRLLVDRRLDDVSRAIDTCYRLAIDAHSHARDDLERARRVEPERLGLGVMV